MLLRDSFNLNLDLHAPNAQLLDHNTGKHWPAL